jgi:hypothetical protein
VDDIQYIDEKLLETLEKSGDIVQNKLKNVSTSILESAIIILNGEIEKKKIGTLNTSKKKLITQYTFIKNVISKEVFERKW